MLLFYIMFTFAVSFFFFFSSRRRHTRYWRDWSSDVCSSDLPRAAMFTSAVFWVSGFLVGSLGIATEQLWLLYLGYGVLGGIGLGIGYISPVSTLIKWFPDRPGLATGMAIMGFGGGALIASPLSRQLMSFFDPSYVPTDTTSVASGDAVAKLFLTLGLVYLVFMMFGAFLVRVPGADWKPQGFDPASVKKKALVTTENVSASNALKTPQFWLLWTVLFCNVTAGIGILEQASPMIQDFFRTGDGSLVATSAAAGFVGVLSLFNMAGRFVWSSTSDYIGRKPIYMVYLGVGIVLYLVLAILGSTATWIFVLTAAVIISFYGGGFATVPADLRDRSEEHTSELQSRQYLVCRLLLEKKKTDTLTDTNFKNFLNTKYSYQILPTIYQRSSNVYFRTVLVQH